MLEVHIPFLLFILSLIVQFVFDITEFEIWEILRISITVKTCFLLASYIFLAQSVHKSYLLFGCCLVMVLDWLKPHSHDFCFKSF